MPPPDREGVDEDRISLPASLFRRTFAAAAAVHLPAAHGRECQADDGRLGNRDARQRRRRSIYVNLPRREVVHMRDSIHQNRT